MSKISDQPSLAPKSEKDKKTEDKKETAGKSVQNNPAAENASKNLSKNVDAIDNLLGTLSSDMEKMGVRTTAKGHCAACEKSITGKVSDTDRQTDRQKITHTDR